MYKWDMNDVSREIRRYQTLKNQENDEDKKEEIQGTIYSFLELQDYYRMVIAKTNAKLSSDYYSIESKTDFRDVIYDDHVILRRFGMYAPIVRDFNNSFSYSRIEQEKPLEKMKISSDGIVKVTTSLFNGASEFYRDTYALLSKHFSSRLAFINLKNGFDCSGYTHPIYGTDRVYIDVGRNNTLQDYVSLFHETSHGITFTANQDVIWDENKYCFSEVDSLFWELVGTDYAGKLFNKEEAERLKRATFVDYLYNADLLCSKMDMYSVLSKKELKDKRIINNYLRNEIGFDKTAVKHACTTSIREYLLYIVSYLTAIELYLIYKIDKNYALEVLQKIIMLKDLDIEEYLDVVRSLGIYPGKNINQYFEMISPKGGFGYVKRV